MRDVNGCSVPPQAGIQLSLVVVWLFIEPLDYQSGLGYQELFFMRCVIIKLFLLTLDQKPKQSAEPHKH